MKVALAVMRAQQQKAAAAQIARHRMHHRQRETRATAASTALPPSRSISTPGIGGQMVHADHHSVARAYRLLAPVGKHVLRVLLGCGMRHE